MKNGCIIMVTWHSTYGTEVDYPVAVYANKEDAIKGLAEILAQHQIDGNFVDVQKHLVKAKEGDKDWRRYLITDVKVYC